MTAEDRIHVVLVLALAAANVGIYRRGPAALEPGPEATLAWDGAPVQLNRADLERAIEQLESWLAGARRQAAPGWERELALEGLAPTPEERAQPARWLERSLGADGVRTWLANVAAPAQPDDPALAGPRRTALGLLLEAGVPLDRELGAGTEGSAPQLTLAQLLEHALRTDDRSKNEPVELDLLSFAVLGGMQQYRDELADGAQAALHGLRRNQHEIEGLPGVGELTSGALRQRAALWRQGSRELIEHGRELAWSRAVFRATAVLASPELELQARRHLSALLLRYRGARSLYRHLASTASDERERARVRLQMLEQLGCLEEVLYNAHLGFRRAGEDGPGPHTALVMRMAARELIDQLQSLDAASFEAAARESPELRESLLRAAVQALRGLRSARVAG